MDSSRVLQWFARYRRIAAYADKKRNMPCHGWTRKNAVRTCGASDYSYTYDLTQTTTTGNSYVDGILYLYPSDDSYTYDLPQPQAIHISISIRHPISSLTAKCPPSFLFVFFSTKFFVPRSYRALACQSMQCTARFMTRIRAWVLGRKPNPT